MLHPYIVVRNKGVIDGYGLFATRPIPKKALIWTLSILHLHGQKSKRGRTSSSVVSKKYGFQCGENRFSLATGRSREMNHSCDPNTWWADSDNIIARRDILTDEEITYDYSSCDIDLECNMQCSCGSSYCRKNISNHDYLDFNWQQQYGVNLPAHVLNAIAKAQSLSST